MVVVAGGSWTEGKGENRPNTSVNLSLFPDRGCNLTSCLKLLQP